MIIKKAMKVIFALLLIIIILCITWYFLIYLVLQDDDRDIGLPRDINIQIVNEIEYNSNDTLFITETELDYRKHETTFWIITPTGETPLFKVQYSGKYESVKFRKYDEYIFFWLNGSGYEIDEYPTENRPARNLRSATDSNVYKYNIITAEVEEISPIDSNRTVIIDILMQGDKEIIVKEVAANQNEQNLWLGVKTYIGAEQYDFSITDCYSVYYRGTVIGTDIIMPTTEYIVVIDDSDIERKVAYQQAVPVSVELHDYAGSIISIIKTDKARVLLSENGYFTFEIPTITQYDDLFQKKNEIELSHSCSQSMFLENWIACYGVDEKGSLIISVIYLENLTVAEFKVGQLKYVNQISELLLKLDYYQNKIILYDKMTGRTFAEVLDIY